MRKRITIQKNDSITFERGFEEFILNCKARNLRDATIKHYNESYKYITRVLDGDKNIDEFNIKTVDKFILDCKEKLDISTNTIYIYQRDLKTMFYYFMRCEYMPTFKILLIKTDKKRVEIYKDSELTILLKKPNKNCIFTDRLLNN